MKYRETMEFAPIETVIQLRDADDILRGRRLLEEYVIGDDMADRLIGSIFPVLAPTEDTGRGLLVVGNYGTGKSHLLAVLSTLAADRDAVEALTYPGVASAAAGIAGRFIVVRAELGATTMSLRDFICGELEAHLQGIGMEFRFPTSDRVGGHKRLFAALIDALRVHTEKEGLLLVLDELLDYLRTRSDRDLAFDLNFLRELGEITRLLPFRFVAGVQEGLFGNPRFQFVAQALKRVEDRFDEVRISSGDLHQIVAARIVPRSDRQTTCVAKHLGRFAPFFPALGEDLDLHARLFPVHPAYLDELATLASVEKREVLRTLSSSISRILESDIPATQPGVISYDDFWQFANRAGQRARPDRRSILHAVKAAEDRLVASLPQPVQKECALRILRALAVRRLGAGEQEEGISAAKLRDELFLFADSVAELGGVPADDALGFVDSTLDAMKRALAGQFISTTAEGGYFLDLHRTEDFEAVLAHRTESIGSSEVDRLLLQTLLEILIPPHGAQEKGCSVPWPGHGISRRVSIFRAQPESADEGGSIRLILLAPREAARSARAGDIFIRTPLDTELDRLFRRAAAATELVSSSTGESSRAYAAARRETLYLASNRLRRELSTGAQVGRSGKLRGVTDWLRGEDVRSLLALGPLERAGPRELLLLCVGIAARPLWESEAPEYPRFRYMLPAESLPAAAREAVHEMAGIRRTDAGHAVLEGLELLTGEELTPLRSRYVRHLVSLLARQKPGLVLNRGSILLPTPRGARFVPGRFGLEPDLVAVLCAAIVKVGFASLWVQERLVGAGDFMELAALPTGRLVSFRCLVPPPAWSDAVITTLLESQLIEGGFDPGIPAGRSTSIGVAIGQLIPPDGRVIDGSTLREALEASHGRADPQPPDLLAYLSRAESHLPVGHPWCTALSAAKRKLGTEVMSGGSAPDPAPLLALKRSYIRLYSRLHRRSRLSAAEDALKSALVADGRASALAAFSGTEGFPEQQFRLLQENISRIRSCYGLQLEHLEGTPICRFCSYSPRSESVGDSCAAKRLSAASDDLDSLYRSWFEHLRMALQAAHAKCGTDLLPELQRRDVERFIASGELPRPIADSFIGAARELIRGLEPLELSMELIRDRLRGSNPGSPDELRHRFEVVLHEALRGKRPERIRILVV